MTRLDEARHSPPLGSRGVHRECLHVRICPVIHALLAGGGKLCSHAIQTRWFHFKGLTGMEETESMDAELGGPLHSRARC